MNRHGVVVIIFNEKNEVLLVRQNNERNAWTFVSGGVEDGEGSFQTAIRETKEEVNLDLDPKSILDTKLVNKFEYGNSGDIGEQKVYLARTKPKQKVQIDNDEVIDYRWLPISYVHDFLTYPDLGVLYADAVPVIRNYVSRGKGK